MNKKVLVVDLDETLYSINTFHYFIKYLAIKSVKKLDVILLIRLLFFVIYRKIHLISHAKMKYSILKIIQHKTYFNYDHFVKSIVLKKRSLSVINDSFDIKILATAAPSCYASIIANNEGFDYCLGTNFPNDIYNVYFENVRDNKKRNVMKLLNLHDIQQVHTNVTDHIDDLPLMKLSKKNIIINPSDKLKHNLKQNAISFKELKKIE